MAQDTVDHAGICNKGDDAHGRPAAAQEGIGFEDFLDQPSPGAASFPGKIRIVLLGMIRWRRGSALAIGGRHGNLAMASAVRITLTVISSL